MALLWCDAFELTSSTAIRARYEASDPLAAPAAGRTNMGADLDGGYLEKRFNQGYQTLVIGLAKNSIASNRELIRLYDSAGNLQVTLLDASDSTYKLYRGNSTSGTLLATSSVVTAGIMVYLELLITISATVGAFEFRVNELTQFSGSAANTRNGAYDDIARVQINGLPTTPPTVNCYVDDFYIANTAAPAPLGYFLGNVKVEHMVPNGPGAVTGWTKFNDSNWRNVDELPHNSDVDYNYSSTQNASDLYSLGNMSASSGSIRGVQLTAVERKDDALPRSTRPLLRTGGVTYAGGTDSLTTSYAFYYEIWDQNPQTASEWEISAINALEIGLQVS